MQFKRVLLIGSVLLAGHLFPNAWGETFMFGAGSQNNINGSASAYLIKGGFTLQLQPVISGSLLSELSSAGMGIDSTPVVGAGSNEAALFDVLGGSGPLAGSREAVQFSFLQPGVLTGINFDGVKDESLEYFILEGPGGTRINFFDSAANTTIPGAVNSAVGAHAITGAVVYLLEINSSIDDEAQNLQIPFTKDQIFTLTFDSLGADFHPLLASNGARLQGITVQGVPEPTSSTIAVGLVLVGGLARSSRRISKRACGRSRT